MAEHRAVPDAEDPIDIGIDGGQRPSSEDAFGHRHVADTPDEEAELR